MTNKEAITQMDSLMDNSRSFHEEKGDIWEKDIEALNIAKRAIQKQIPKKSINICRAYFGKGKHGDCPNCKVGVNSIEYKYCRICGQALKWGDTDD